ncbi:hypothetical protein FB451DRAFT_278446 [Mycena latifolia]|nr:hypothetical protein FB451DRAFT_278446 [Mycena latifolia]
MKPLSVFIGNGVLILTSVLLQTVLRVIQESPHLFLDDIQQELSTSHGLTLSLPQISSILNSTEMPHKQVTIRTHCPLALLMLQ